MDRAVSRRPAIAWRVALPTLLVIGVVATAAALIGLSDRGREESAGSPPGIAHVHGLGIDPGDGALMVATHTGLFRIEDGAGSAGVARVGGSFQDTMGFTVAGPSHYLGSGHPDVAGFGDGQPGLLGLIESTDGGETWRPLSLSGEVDFHGLAVTGDVIYGWDSTSGGLMTTTDRRTWETRSTIDALGFVVDPGDPDHLVLATPAGLEETSDGGHTWSAAHGPDLVALSWDEEAGLWGADAAGQVWQGDGQGWETVGSLDGEPHALLATPQAFYAATTDEDGTTTIFRSSDARRWETLYRDG